MNEVDRRVKGEDGGRGWHRLDRMSSRKVGTLRYTPVARMIERQTARLRRGHPLGVPVPVSVCRSVHAKPLTLTPEERSQLEIWRDFPNGWRQRSARHVLFWHAQKQGMPARLPPSVRLAVDGP
jgi:hypothetical protein